MNFEDEHEEPQSKGPGLDPARLADWVIFIGLCTILYLITSLGQKP